MEAYGRDLPDLFGSAACGLFEIITDLESIGDSESHLIEATATDLEALLVAWLNGFVYRLDAENLLFRRYEILELSDRHQGAGPWRARGRRAARDQDRSQVGDAPRTGHR